MKILLADDDIDQLELRRLLLAEEGFEIIAVTTAAAALQEAGRSVRNARLLI